MSAVTEDRRKSAAEIAALFELAAGEGAVIARLDGCVAQIRAVQQAKAELADVTAEQIREALEYRRRVTREQP